MSKILNAFFTIIVFVVGGCICQRIKIRRKITLNM